MPSISLTSRLGRHLIAAVIVALLFRALAPAGFMPDAAASVLAPCDGGLAAPAAAHAHDAPLYDDATPHDAACAAAHPCASAAAVCAVLAVAPAFRFLATGHRAVGGPPGDAAPMSFIAYYGERAPPVMTA